MSKADEVIKRLQEENRTYRIQITGDEENKDNAFGILMNTQAILAIKDEGYTGIKKSTLDLLDEAEIKYKILQ